MKKKRTKKQQEGYSPNELRAHMHAYIKASAEQLRKELRVAWKKQASEKRRARHAVTI